MSIRYAQPTNVCIICGIRTRGLPCPTCDVEKTVEETMFKKIKEFCISSGRGINPGRNFYWRQICG